MRQSLRGFGSAGKGTHPPPPGKEPWYFETMVEVTLKQGPPFGGTSDVAPSGTLRIEDVASNDPPGGGGVSAGGSGAAARGPPGGDNKGASPLTLASTGWIYGRGRAVSRRWGAEANAAAAAHLYPSAGRAHRGEDQHQHQGRGD